MKIRRKSKSNIAIEASKVNSAIEKTLKRIDDWVFSRFPLTKVLVIIVAIVAFANYMGPSKKKDFANHMEKDCAEFIVCLSAKRIAKEYGRTEMWALQNYKVNVWERTSANGKGKRVGEMLCGSRARIIDRSGEDYQILSPLDNSIGWVNKIQIEYTIYQNPNTYEDCEGG